MENLTIKVTGKVQGVYFRVTTKSVADQLGIQGYVMNLEDGSVLIEAEGKKHNMDLFLEWCHKGPDHAEVLEVHKTPGIVKGYTNFVVRRK